VIIVTGTKRSGTSLWMQILAAAGMPIIGERFPTGWAEVLAAANPDGYYESQLVNGVFYRTNPHPATGDYLRPEQTRDHAVKIFIPGLVRTDLIFIDRVLATVREWRQYCASVERLQRVSAPSSPFASSELDQIGLPPVLQWWTYNFALVRDAATRGYPIHVTSYQSLLEDPHAILREALQWLDDDAPQAASRVVRARGNTISGDVPTPEGVTPRHADIFDQLYGTIHRGHALTPSLIEALNSTDEQLRPTIVEHTARARLEAARRLIESESP